MNHPVVDICIKVKARQTDTPGLFIHFMYTNPKRFQITHGPSGLGIANFDDKNDAYGFARKMKFIANWLEDSYAIGKWPLEIKQRVYKLIESTPGAIKGGRVKDGGKI